MEKLGYALSDDSDLSSVQSISPRSSPEPAKRYLTPSSQDAEDSTRQDCPPPAKKRRRNPLPKERTTQYLSLAKSSLDQQDQTKLLVDTLRHQKDIVVIAGAGISTSAGIPDFRSTDGLFKSLQKKHNLKASGKLLFDAAVYQDDALTAPFHEMVRSLSVEAANCKPTKFHEMLARLGKENRLKRLYTQNIDGLETSMKPLETEIPLSVKGRWPVTIQLHGSITKMVCQKCRYLCDLMPNRFCEADPPECDECSVKNEVRQTSGQRSHGVGRMRPRIVLYNEHNPDEEAITSVMNADVRSRPRVLVVAGTSLKIPGVRRLVKSLCTVIRSRKDGVTMFINNEPPVGKEFENCFDLIVQGTTDEVADLVKLKHWEDPTPYEMSLPEPVFGPQSSSEEELSSSDSEQKQNNFAVVVSTPKKRPRNETGLFTPSSSHDEKPATKKPTKGKLANPASRGASINDLLNGAKTTAPAKPARKKAVPKTTAPKKRGPKAQPPKAANISSFAVSTKAAATAAAPADKKIVLAKPMHPMPAARTNGLMFPNLGKKDGVEAPETMPLPITATSS
ncbi:NAD-dependent protein deacetylase hst4 [Penicillium macrosclerotiorum]|uniref:NAD-dependent protein deacetylase hst4 n=1 Tax=Penicillium macrosclerotiorum TaxID=303699 RepID=UPI002548E8DC|nr:NAD-dependent protein deacetylase hst4 [Penicillium macrosclerotiorum]KAJ5664604.1 NAD-dependent protein deacetylase hst4 [Penicillium macrosclerotiorum]